MASGVGVFWNSAYSSFNSTIMTSLLVSFGQYLLILIGMLYAWGLAIAASTFVLSRFCSSYIPLIAGGIVVVVASLIISNNWIFKFPLNNFIYEVNNALFEPMLCGILLLVGIAIGVFVVQRERRVDVI
jgi:uncharacterized membrane protein